MPLVSLKGAGRLGAILDVPPFDLDPLAWSKVMNARFRNGCVQPGTGNWPVYGDMPEDERPLWLMYCPVPDGEPVWITPTLTSVFAGHANVMDDVTRAVGGPYNASEFIGWNGGVLGGIPIINNGVDVPQAWLTPGVAGAFEDLPNWPATDRARVIRMFRQFAIALDITKAGVRYPSLVKWSTLADPGFVPSSWDPTDPTQLAGESPLSDTPDDIVDCLPLRDVNIIYKQRSVHVMQFTQSFDVFSFRKLFSDFGLLATECVREVNGRHIVLTGDDLIMHDGNQWDSLASKRTRDWFFRNMDPTYYYNAFVAVNYNAGEVWFCFPMIGAQRCTHALVWSWKENHFTVQEIPQLVHIDSGFVPANGVRQSGFGGTQWDQLVGDWDSQAGNWGDQQDLLSGAPQTSLNWDQDLGTWDADAEAWDSVLDSKSRRTMVGARDHNEFPLQMLDVGTRNLGVEIPVEVERVGLAIEGQDFKGEPIVDLGSMKLIRAIYWHFESQPELALECFLGSQMTIQGPIEWSGPFKIDASNDFKVNCTINTRLLAWKLKSLQDSTWRLSGVMLDVDKVSRF